MSGSVTSPSAEGARIYENDRSVAEYLEFHYGPRHLDVPNFPSACAEAAIAALELSGHAGRGRALDVGCAVGRSAFELARSFVQVDAIDFSHRFVEAGSRLASGERLAYDIPTEGLLSLHRTASLADLRLDGTAPRVQFAQGDACALADGLTHYDLVLAANLIDRLHDPSLFLARIADRVVPGGLLAITSPYTWLETYTPPDKWLGGRVVDGRPVGSLEGLTAALEPGFERIDRRDIPFVIRETARKHQHTVAEFTAWRRR
jgi:putative 4-mercaptohistidine N1-methyltranferase